MVAIKKCIASLFTDRAISYRADKGFTGKEVALSVGVQVMVRSDLASSGVMFTLDTETGFNKVVVINGSYGLGEMIVQGRVTPDEFIIFKPTLDSAKNAIIAHNISKKERKIIYARKGIVEVKVPNDEQMKQVISDDEILNLAKWGVMIEKHFSEKRGHLQHMDIEWAKDGLTGKMFIVQARPETIHTTADKKVFKEYRLKSSTGFEASKRKLLLEGTAVGTKIGAGKVRVIKSAEKINEFQKGEVLVTEMTDPDWEPIMKIASAIVTDKGGRTSHAAIVSRELGIPCIVGSGTATSVLKSGMEITVDSTGGTVGKVYEGILPFETIEHNLGSLTTSNKNFN